MADIVVDIEMEQLGGGGVDSDSDSGGSVTYFEDSRTLFEEEDQALNDAAHEEDQALLHATEEELNDAGAKWQKDFMTVIATWGLVLGMAGLFYSFLNMIDFNSLIDNRLIKGIIIVCLVFTIVLFLFSTFKILKERRAISQGFQFIGGHV